MTKKIGSSKKIKTALICEDNPELNESLREFLTELGFDVTCTFDGTQAVNAIQTTQYDLITMDFRIPHLNGLQVCAVARATSLNRKSKIYIITGEVDPSVEARAQALRVNRFFLKPFNMRTIEQNILADFEAAENKFTYDTKLINIFLDAAAEVYEFYFNHQPQRGRIAVRKQGEAERGFCTGMIEFSAKDFVGSLGLGMTKPFVKQLSNALFAGMDVNFDEQFLADVTGEMCNQIVGKVKLNFAKVGVPITIGLPKVVMGENHIIQHRVPNPLIAVPIGKQDAVFELQFVLSHCEVKFANEPEQSKLPKDNVILF